MAHSKPPGAGYHDLLDRGAEAGQLQMEILYSVRALGSVGTNQIVAVLPERCDHGRQKRTWFQMDEPRAKTAVCVEVPKT